VYWKTELKRFVKTGKTLSSRSMRSGNASAPAADVEKLWSMIQQGKTGPI
jgi:hypothetical protein